MGASKAGKQFVEERGEATIHLISTAAISWIASLRSQ
jgi:hypothetical protein